MVERAFLRRRLLQVILHCTAESARAGEEEETKEESAGLVERGWSADACGVRRQQKFINDTGNICRFTHNSDSDGRGGHGKYWPISVEASDHATALEGL